MTNDVRPAPGLRTIIYDVIFGYESRAGKLFDLILIWLIVASVTAVLLDSIGSFHARNGAILAQLEWFFTILFTIEYALRLYSYPRKLEYITSFYGIIDLVSILPTYIAFLFPSAIYLVVIRIMRVLRIFRILKTVPLYGRSESACLRLAAGQTQDIHIPVLGGNSGHNFRGDDVHHRGSGKRLRQYSQGYLLGHSDHNYSRLR
jgi:hypothetical protein